MNWVISNGSTVIQGGAVLVLLLLLMAIFQGKIVPAATLDRMTVQWEKRLAESQERERDWRTAYEKADARADTASGQVEVLMGYAQTMDQFVRSVRPERKTRS